MALNVTEENAGGGGDPVQRDYAKAGPRVAIISGIIDLGIQPQEYKGEVQKSCREFTVLLTLVADKYKDDEGKEHNMVTSPWPVKIKLGEKSNYTKFIKAADPRQEVLNEKGIGDISKLIGRGVFAVMKHTTVESSGITYANCSGIQELPEDYPMQDTPYNSVVFDASNPDKEIFDKLRDRTKKLIESGEGWKGFDGVASSVPAPKQAESLDENGDDDIPF